MSKETNRKKSRSRAKKGSSSFIFITVAVILVCVIGFYFYVRQSPQRQYPSQFGTPAQDEIQSDASENSITAGAGRLEQPLDTSTSGQQGQFQGADPVVEEENGSDIRSALVIETDQPSLEFKETPVREYQYLIDQLNAFYTHLDQQPYMQTFKLEESSRVHFSKLIQKVVDNPPVVTRETDDLFTLLKNTAHFFRILGKNNIIILKGILDREKESLEDILQTFYTLTLHPEYLQEEYEITLPFDALYDYAGFFLNTMGGRLYLFRRDSTSRMAVSYYAILVVDRAASEGIGDHGIDLRPAIDFLIDEIETGGARLRLRDEYLDTLYDLKEKYN